MNDETGSLALTYDIIIKEFYKWAKNETDIRSVVITGSRARTDHPADKWSDLDFMVFADNSENYVQPGSWVEDLGKVVLTFVEATPDERFQERRVMYEGGLDVDFVFIPLEVISRMLEGTLAQEFYEVISRGAKILFDKDGMVEQLIKRGIRQPSFKPPPKDEFLNVINDFLFHSVWTAKHLRRGEIWWAKSCCDGYLKTLLRRMLEWHAKAKKGKRYDTWLRGRFLEELADPRAVKELNEAFAHYNEADIWRALINTMELFRWVAKETAQGFGYAYPSDADKYTTALVLQMELGR